MDENKTNATAEAVEKVPVAGKFWLSFADCLCGTLNSLLTGGGMTYFFTKFIFSCYYFSNPLIELLDIHFFSSVLLLNIGRY